MFNVLAIVKYQDRGVWIVRQMRVNNCYVDTYELLKTVLTMLLPWGWLTCFWMLWKRKPCHILISKMYSNVYTRVSHFVMWVTKKLMLCSTHLFCWTWSTWTCKQDPVSLNLEIFEIPFGKHPVSTDLYYDSVIATSYPLSMRS